MHKKLFSQKYLFSQKDGFSLLEIIFLITIVSIIAVVAIPKLTYNINETNIIKLRADVALIRDGINSFKNKQILSNSNKQLESLDNGDQLLFSSVLQQPLFSQVNKGGSWSKGSLNTYKAWIDSQNSIEFVYNFDDLSFNCDFEEEYCKELAQ